MKKNLILKKSLICPKLRYYYELLNVTPSDSKDIIKKVYRDLAVKFHPDKNENSDLSKKLFADIANAYNVLTDDQKIIECNEDYFESLPKKIRISGHTLDIGGFFGTRYFRRDTVSMYSRKRKIFGQLSDNNTPTGKNSKFQEIFFDEDYFEEENSILDHPDWDMAEIMFSGKMDKRAKIILRNAFIKNGMDSYYDLPWVIGNIEGFYHFINGNFRLAVNIFEKLNQLIQNNIVFMYRLGISYKALFFKKFEKYGEIVFKSDISYLKKSVILFEKAIKLGKSRMITEKQHCFTIRKALADIYEVLGGIDAARKMWQYIFKHKYPYSIEAKEKLKDLSKYRFIRKKKYNIVQENLDTLHNLLRKDKSAKELISERIQKI